MKEEIKATLERIRDYVQRMREDGDSDLRSIISHIEYEIRKLNNHDN